MKNLPVTSIRSRDTWRNSGLLKYTYVISLLYLIMHSLVLYRYAGNLLEGFSQTQISTLAVKDNLLVAGGFQGELTCKVSHFWQLCYSISSAVLITRLSEITWSIKLQPCPLTYYSALSFSDIFYFLFRIFYFSTGWGFLRISSSWKSSVIGWLMIVGFFPRGLFFLLFWTGW